MATRSRTLLFLQYRNSFARSNNLRSSNTTSAFDSYSNNYENVGLIESSEHVIELSILPPKWVDIVEEVDELLDQIKKLIPQLDELHKRHILPGFDDRTNEEKEMEKLTDEITRLFEECQRKVKKIANENNLSAKSDQEQIINKNIQTSLALKIQNVSLDFRKKQTAYLKKLKVRGNRNPGLFATDNVDVIEENWELGFSDQQLELIESSEAVISQREHEINEISKSINILVEVFKNMQTLVIDQGTLLDRIDYNVEQMSINVKAAAKVLEQGASYQKKSRNRKIIILLLLLILGLVIVLIFKPRKHG